MRSSDQGTISCDRLRLFSGVAAAFRLCSRIAVDRNAGLLYVGVRGLWRMQTSGDKEAEVHVGTGNMADLLLKYGVLIAGTAYLAGVISLQSYFSPYGISASLILRDIGYSRIVYSGARVLFPFLCLLFVPLCVMMLAGRKRWVAWALLPVSVLVFLQLEIGLRATSIVQYAPTVCVLPIASAFAIAAFVSRSPLTPSRQLTSLVVFLFGLYVWALDSGRIASANELLLYTPDVRLLVSPEAQQPLEQLGILFGQSEPGKSVPLLSEPVESVFATDTNVVVRLADKRIVTLRRDKIWGMVDLKQSH